jgi:hypothetical protein
MQLPSLAYMQQIQNGTNYTWCSDNRCYQVCSDKQGVAAIKIKN